MKDTDKACGVCKRIQQIEEKTNPFFVAELISGYVVVGDHQLFRGYALLLCKEHKTEIHQLDINSRKMFLDDMSDLAEAVFNSFQPRKLNYELLGNGMEHMHWHIIPRHAGDPCPLSPIWVLDKAIRYADNVRPSQEELLDLKNTLLDELKRIAGGKILKTFLNQNIPSNTP